MSVFIDSQMRRSQAMQHYRTKQRQYLQWRRSQEEQQEVPCYFPPQLRELRNEWFAKRYVRYRNQASTGKIGATTSDDAESRPNSSSSTKIENEWDELDAVRQKIWRWLNLEDNEDYERLLHEDEK
jgi:hypothetical protein